jgi:hypothetical protein
LGYIAQNFRLEGIVYVLIAIAQIFHERGSHIRQLSEMERLAMTR